MEKHDLYIDANGIQHNVIIAPIAEWNSGSRVAFDVVVNADTEFKTECNEESAASELSFGTYYVEHVEGTRCHVNEHSITEASAVKCSEEEKGTITTHPHDVIKHTVIPEVHASAVKKTPKMDKNNLKDMKSIQHSEFLQDTDTCNVRSVEKDALLTQIHSYVRKKVEAADKDRSYNSPKSFSFSGFNKNCAQIPEQSHCNSRVNCGVKNTESSGSIAMPLHNCELKNTSNIVVMHNIETNSNRDGSGDNLIAWEPAKRCFDNMSLSSSHFDADSNCSDLVETVSSVSDVSGYEEEIFRIKRLLLQDPSVPPLKKQNSRKNSRDHGVRLNKYELFVPSESTNKDPHNRNVCDIYPSKESSDVLLKKSESELAIKWQEKCQEALRQKAHVEGRLESLLKEIEILRKEKQDASNKVKLLESEAKSSRASELTSLFRESENLYLENDQLQKLLREKNKENLELKSIVDLSIAEKNKLKDEMKNMESINEKLRIELQELQVELESKIGSVSGLKSKITDLHMECQSLLQGKLKAENSVTTLKNDLISSQKLTSWYRDQLHLSQAARTKVQQDLMASQTNLMSYSQAVEKLRAEKSQLQNLVDDLEQKMVREKQNLVRKLEVIQAEMFSREAVLLSQVRPDGNSEGVASKDPKSLETTSLLENPADKVSELEQQVDELRKDIIHRDNRITQLEEENAALLIKANELQIIINEKNACQQNIENKYGHLEMSNQHLKDALKTTEQQLMDIKNEKIALEVTLSAALREKAEIDSSIKQLREDISCIQHSYTAMKTKLLEKEKEIIDVKEKLEESKRIYTVKEHVQGEQTNSLNYKQNSTTELNNVEQELHDLKNENLKLKDHVFELQNSLSIAQSNDFKLQEVLKSREEELHTLSAHLETIREEVDSRNKGMLELKERLQAVEETNFNMKKELEDRTNENCSLLKEVDLSRFHLLQTVVILEHINHRAHERKEEINSKFENIIKYVEGLNCEPEISPVQITSTLTDWLESGLQMFLEKCNNCEPEASHIDNKCQEKECNEENFLATWVFKLVKVTAVLKFLSDYRQNLLLEAEKLTPSRNCVEEEIGELNINVFQNSLCSAKGFKLVGKPQSDVLSTTKNKNVCNFCKQYDRECVQYRKEIETLRCQKTKLESELHEKYRRYELNTRILLKKVKEHLRCRKAAERQLQLFQMQIGIHKDELCKDESDATTLQAKIKKLEMELESSYKQLEQQKNLAEKYQNNLLELERYKGKLEQQQSMIQQTINVSDIEIPTVIGQLDEKAKEMKYQQALARLQEAEQQADHYLKSIEELKREIFLQKTENSQLRKELKNSDVDLTNAHSKLERKSSELMHVESLYDELTNSNSCLQEQLHTEQKRIENYQEELAKVKMELEEARAKDPILEDQIKTLGYHLHQRTQEISDLKERAVIDKENCEALENGFTRKIEVLYNELSELRKETDVIHRDKLRLQTHSSELKLALQSVIKQNEVLKKEFISFHSKAKDKIHTVIPSISPPPAIHNEAQIQDLLYQSSILQENKPLNNLQCCLESLKQEMTMLQEQLAARTSQDTNQNITALQSEQTSVKTV
ncbi:golgin subfamily A member 3-like [Schistocerca cancellata]|uniref:golgin subfamily A member 3-like n=1 Tax=Schistocerca cancellata TaxID=274614 RepID=UPI002117B62B|nr:golgin subfamily A member 3-like [Schistocerca cancellata]